MAGGPLAVVNEGDYIEIDINNNSINLLVSDNEIKDRLKSWTAPESKIKEGYLGRYAKLVTSAAKGAVLE